MSYQKKDWQDLPDINTPVTATDLDRMENGIADANGAIGADAYDSTATYAVGDICIYNNKLYRCNTAISTAEAWNSNHWTEINLLDNSILITSESSGVATGTNKKISSNCINMEEGEWTPIISTVENVAPTLTYIYQYGYYWKFNKYCYIQFYIRSKITALNGTNNYACVKGYPFGPAARGYQVQVLTPGPVYGITDANAPYTFGIDSSGIKLSNSNGTMLKLKITSGSYCEISCSGWYRIAD